MTPSGEEIVRRVVEIIADALECEPSRVHLHASLIDDLGAESIDFLDIRYRVERAFDIKIEDDDLWQGFLLGEHPELLGDEGITPEGVERLRDLVPDFCWDRFPRGVSKENLPRLISVRTVVEYLEHRFRSRGRIKP